MLDASSWQALAGGLLIGLSASVLMLFSGRVAGISGIFQSMIFKSDGRAWRASFIGGLLLGAVLCHALTGKPVPQLLYSNPLLAIAAGFLVGFGVSKASGCTSGHGVCGLARLSRRSLAATACFMSAAIATVAIVNQLV